jgi:hypothetical protein
MSIAYLEMKTQTLLVSSLQPYAKAITAQVKSTLRV